ncbi:membrane protein involved in the export of O-antigen and teichoic acid [Calothrix sp. NIES-4071]|nr:membrane protein involved in the export of O-antigen and teichoic acid [Calothrix sp. NIES-4071]BAZ63315.1 membrane protein involved in the export of O-antigen and teichoic acid [Calothrix sp. NIES-4105]
MNISSLIKHGFWATYGAFATRFLGLFSNLMLARLLTPSEFGVIGTAYIFWSFVNLFTQGSVGEFIIYKGTEDKRYLNNTYTVTLGIATVFGLTLAAASPFIANFFSVPVLMWILFVFAGNFLLSSLYWFFSGVMTRQMQYKQLANTNMIASLVRVFVTVGSALAGLSYWSFVIGDVASSVTGCVLMSKQIKHKFQLQFDKEIGNEVLSYCLGATGSSFGYYVNANCDNLIVGKILGTTSLGFYNFAYQGTMTLTTVFGQVIDQIGMSVFAQLPDEKQQEKALARSLEQIAFLAAPMYGLLLLMIDQQTITLIFGDKWLPIIPIIPGLVVFAYFRLLNRLLSAMLSAKGRPDVNAKVNLVIAPIALLSFFIGATHLGMIGVSIAVAVVLGFGWTTYWWWVGCHEFNWSVKKFLILCFLPVFVALPAIKIAYFLPLVLKPITFIALYGVGIFILSMLKIINLNHIFKLNFKNP